MRPHHLNSFVRHWLRIPDGIDTICRRRPNRDAAWIAHRLRLRIDIDAFWRAREILLREPRQRGIRRATQAALRLPPYLSTLERYEHELNLRLAAARERTICLLNCLPAFSPAAMTPHALAVPPARPNTPPP